jgi:hypothetical protein
VTVQKVRDGEAPSRKKKRVAFQRKSKDLPNSALEQELLEGMSEAGTRQPLPEAQSFGQRSAPVLGLLGLRSSQTVLLENALELLGSQLTQESLACSALVCVQRLARHVNSHRKVRTNVVAN